MKRKFFSFLTIGLIASAFFVGGLFSVAKAETKLPVVILFHGEECPHCQEERAFLADLKKEMPDLEIKEYEVWHNQENQKIFEETARRLGQSVSSVPFTVIGNRFISGFGNPETTGKEIRNLIKNNSIETPDSPDTKNIPVLGKINLKTASLPVLTALIGVLDGFNPCSMWALVTMIALILSTGSRKKLWLVGWTFIFVSGFSYFLFMTAWLNAFFLMGHIQLVQILVGLVGLGSGAISLKEFFTKKPKVCEVGTPEKQEEVMSKFEKIIQATSIYAIIVGVVGVAFSVNLVEMMCSLGFPVIFTQALALHNLAIWQKYLYIAVYVLFYMLLNVIVLLMAGTSMKFWAENEKFQRYSRLVAGIMMIILGAIFIFKPELLSF